MIKLAPVRSHCSRVASCAGPSSICPGAHAVETLEGASETAFVTVSGGSGNLLDGLRGRFKRRSRHLEADAVDEVFGRFAGRIDQASGKRPLGGCETTCEVAGGQRVVGGLAHKMLRIQEKRVRSSQMPR